jgi:hypothetical protein
MHPRDPIDVAILDPTIVVRQGHPGLDGMGPLLEVAQYVVQILLQLLFWNK